MAEQKERRPFHHSHTHLLMAAAPLIISELVKDNDKRWRWIRICSLVGAALGEVEQSWQDRKWQDRIEKERAREPRQPEARREERKSERA
jgi:hypothetical protein